MLIENTHYDEAHHLTICIFSHYLSTGFIYDHTTSYIPAFFLAGASPIIGACILCLIRKPGQAETDDDDVFLEQKSSLISATDGFVTGSSSDSLSVDAAAGGSGRSRRGMNGHARHNRRNGTVVPPPHIYNLESELPKKKRPAFFLGDHPENEVKVVKPSTSFGYGPVPVPQKILYSALKENPTNPNRPRLPSNRTSNVSFADMTKMSSSEEDEVFPEETTYILTSKHTVV